MQAKIFLDLDGVVVDFVSEACRAAGLPVGHDEVTSSNFFQPHGLTLQDFWDAIDEEGEAFWAGLKKYPWADGLIGLASTLDPGFHFLTTPSHCPTSWAGKRRWLRERFGGDFHRQIFTKSKELVARENHILIDDSDVNVGKFREAGGRAILFPQRWNLNADYVDNRLAYVVETLNAHVQNLKSKRLDYVSP